MSVFERYTPAEANEFLQERLTTPSVVVSLLHPVMQGRIVRGYEKFEKEFPGVRLRMLSGVRTEAQQIYLYRKYGSPRAANPYYSRGKDFERIEVKGSFHQDKGRPGQKKYGWAVDFQRPSVGWNPVWRIFEKQGIVFVLRKLGGRANEPWHATVRGMNGWFPGQFPENPGVWRRLFKNDIGEDVKALQKQLGELTVDGHYGPATKARVVAVQADMGRNQDGDWGKRDQKYWTLSRTSEIKPNSLRIVIPDEAAVKAVIRVAKSDVSSIDVNADNPLSVRASARQLNKRLDQIKRIVSD